MDFAFTEEQQMFQELFRDFAQNEVAPLADTIDREERPPRETLEKAAEMIYRKAGRVTWHEDRIEVELEPYRYADQQRAMETTCTRFNAAGLHWRDGLSLRITVAAAD